LRKRTAVRAFFKKNRFLYIDILNLLRRKFIFYIRGQRLTDLRLTVKNQQTGYNFYIDYKPYFSGIRFNVNVFNSAWKYI
jgi:hypothetical protein